MECDRQRTIFWRARENSYVINTFVQMAQQYAQIAASMKANGESETIAAVHDSPDAKSTIIDGLTAHHLVETVVGLPNNPFGTSESDVWYSPGADPFACPAFDAIGPKGDRTTTSSGRGTSTGFIAMGILVGPRVPAGSIVLRESTRIGPGMNFITEVTAIKTLPYDPTYFEPPADFVQASPRPIQSFPP